MNNILYSIIFQSINFKTISNDRDYPNILLPTLNRDHLKYYQNDAHKMFYCDCV